MRAKLRVLGLITARGGSKGIPRKNLANLGGKPLIAYTIAAAKKSRLLTRCIVSTEDTGIAAVARKLGADVPFMRPKSLATHASSSVAVAQHAVRWLKTNDGETYDYVMILQPTSPLRTADDIDACIRLAAATDADSVMSMVGLPDFSLAKLKVIKNGWIRSLLKSEGKQSARRTTLPPVYKRNTAIYLTKTALLLKGDLFGKKSRAHVMPRERSVDVNDAIDLALAECLLHS